MVAVYWVARNFIDMTDTSTSDPENPIESSPEPTEEVRHFNRTQDSQSSTGTEAVDLHRLGRMMYMIGTGFLLFYIVVLISPFSYFGSNPIGGIVLSVLVTFVGIGLVLGSAFTNRGKFRGYLKRRS